MSSVQSTMSSWRSGSGDRVVWGGADVGRAGVEALSADSVSEASNEVESQLSTCLHTMGGRRECTRCFT